MGALIGALAAGGVLAGDPALRVALPFDGAVRDGHPTEVHVTLHSHAGGRVAVHVSANDDDANVNVELPAGVARTLAVPLVLRGHSPVTVRVRAGGRDGEAVQAWPSPLRSNVALVVSAVPGLPAPALPQVAWWPAGAAALPRTVYGYGPVSVLVVGAGTLSALDLDQARALDGYLGACGRAVLVDLPSAAAAELRAGAGCGGRAVAAGDLRSVAAALAALLDPAAVPSAPAPQVLDALDRPRSGAATRRAVLLFLGAYAALAVLAALRAPRVAPVLPVGGALVALLAWHGVAPSRSVLLWSEQTSAHSARAVARLAAAGEGAGVAEFALAPGLVPLSLPTGTRRVLAEAEAEGFDSVLHLPVRLLSATEVDLVGVVAVESTLGLAVDARGAQVRNTGLQDSPGAVLVWRGRAVQVPALAPGESWAPHTGAAPAPGATAALAVRRTPPGSAALLVPSTLPWAAPGVETRGWLLVPAGAGARGA